MRRKQILTVEQRNSKTNRQRERRQRDPLGYRNSNLMTRYGITHESYEDRLAANGGGCEICGSKSPRTKSVTTFAVDHDHQTGGVRGILCHPCNWTLGYAFDDPAILRKAAKYLEDSQVGCWEDLVWVGR